MNYAEKNKNILTFHKLKDFLEKGSAYYKAKYIDLLGRDITSDAFTVGRALEDKLKLGEDWGDKYEVVARRGSESEKEQLTKTQGRQVEDGVFELNVNPLFTYEPKNASQYISIEYQGMVVGGEIDELQLTPWKEHAGVIADIKTTKSLDSIREYMPSYIKQLAFYQFLVEKKHGKRLPGLIKAVSKESVAKSEMFYASPDVLYEHRDWIERGIAELKNCTEKNLWGKLTWDVCRKHDDLWGLVKQDSFTILSNQEVCASTDLPF